MSKQRSDNIKLTVFISFACLIVIVCAAISANIIKELKKDREIKINSPEEFQLHDDYETTNHKIKSDVQMVTITNISELEKDKKNENCEETEKIYFTFSKIILAFTAGLILSDGVFIKMGII